MLCNSKINNRPDKLLQSSLIKLSFSLVSLTIVIIVFLLYPQYHLYLIILSAVVSCYCLIATIKTLDAGEAAISYGGFANELIHNSSLACRIENPQGEVIIQNDIAKDLFKNSTVINFLEQNLSEENANKSAFYRLQSAYQNLCRQKVILSLNSSAADRVSNSYEWYEISLQPIYLRKPQIFNGMFSIKKIRKETYFYWKMDNITAKRNMETIFNSENTSLHDFLDYLPVGIYTVNKDYRITYANHCFADFLNVSLAELSNKLLTDFLATNSVLPKFQNKWQGSLYFSLPDGSVKETFVLQNSYLKNTTPELHGVVLNHLPTTEELKDRIEQSSDQISWLFNNAPVGIMFLQSNGIIMEGNQVAFRFFGCSANELINKSIYSFIDEQNSEKLQKELKDICTHNKDSFSIDIKLKNECKKSSAMLYISPMKHLHTTNQIPIKGFVVYLIDNTHQKNLEQQFAQAQKMQAVGQLAGGVAHDFNNLLTAMIGFTDLLLQRHGVGDPSFADLIQIKQNANRAAGLVRQLLAFSRKQPLQPKLIDIIENFAELNHMLKRILGEQITLKFNHGADLGYIKVDPVQFSQVIINLAVNAKDAMNGNGILTIKTSTTTLNEDYQFGDDIIKAGDFVVIDVTDNGCGIAPENISRIFDPFFSTKENIVGSGTGLGLAMVYGIVRQTEGFIKVTSTVGKGTTFSIFLPRFENNEETTAQASLSEVVTGHNGTPILRVQEKITPPLNINQKIIVGLNVSNTIDRTQAVNTKSAKILFVEDEDAVRSFGVRALQKKGYEVIGCNSAENALECVSQNMNIDLLLTDMVMPGMSGAELTQALKEKLPKLKVILASGYSEEIVRQQLPDFDDFDFITKPYSLGDLTAKVFDVLNRE